jgi:hypothetical protein
MRQIFVDSRDRVSGTSTDFAIQLPETLVLEGPHRGRIANLRVPIVFPTIQSGKNDTLQVRVGGTTYTATIAQANYGGLARAAAVQQALAAVAPGVWTVSYDLNNISMTISCSNNFDIVGGTYGAQLLTHPYDHSNPKSYYCSYVTVLGIDVMYLSSSRFSNLDIFGPGGAHDTLMCAINNQPFASVLDVTMDTNSWFDVPNMTTQQLDFQLRDRNYNILSIVPNISFVLVID